MNLGEEDEFPAIEVYRWNVIKVNPRQYRQMAFDRVGIILVECTIRPLPHQSQTISQVEPVNHAFIPKERLDAPPLEILRRDIEVLRPERGVK
jgi:hypothetical protein